MKLILLTSVLNLFVGISGAAAATTVVNYTVNSVIPDNNPTGLADTRTISGSVITGITSVEVRLEISGGWNGDLYAYLMHDSGFSVLLNRPGKTLLDVIGSGSAGFDITLSDAAITDIHDIGPSGHISGSFQPDARNVDPFDVLDTDSRTSFLSSFQGLNANGAWTLFVADNAAGDQSTLLSWGLNISGVPEPSRTVLLMLGGLAMLQRRRRAGYVQAAA
jgi:subtilisin-like proprotein convertase family protein